MTAIRTFDVDIDCTSDVDKTDYGVRSMVYNEKTKRILPHPSGVVLDDIPVDKETGLSSIDYKTATKLGYVSVDMLTNTSYDQFTSKQEVIDLSEKEPNWNMLKEIKYVKKLPHISNHFEILNQVEPKSIDDLADVLALIRPGKAHLLERYLRNKKSTRRELYKRATNEQAFFKKSHSYSYALMIVTIMNKLDLFGLT